MIAIETTQNEDRPLALIVHQDSGAVVWDIRWVCGWKGSFYLYCNMFLYV